MIGFPISCDTLFYPFPLSTSETLDPILVLPLPKLIVLIPDPQFIDVSRELDRVIFDVNAYIFLNFKNISSAFL